MLRWEKTSPRLDHPGRGARDRGRRKGGEPLAPFPIVFVLRGRPESQDAARSLQGLPSEDLSDGP